MKITRESHEMYMAEYAEFMSNTKKKTYQIIKEHKKFGLPSEYPDEYYPCEYVETLDEEYGLIKVYEPGINKYHQVYINNIVIIN